MGARKKTGDENRARNSTHGNGSSESGRAVLRGVNGARVELSFAPAAAIGVHSRGPGAGCPRPHKVLMRSFLITHFGDQISGSSSRSPSRRPLGRARAAFSRGRDGRAQDLAETDLFR